MVTSKVMALWHLLGVLLLDSNAAKIVLLSDLEGHPRTTR